MELLLVALVLENPRMTRPRISKIFWLYVTGQQNAIFDEVGKPEDLVEGVFFGIEMFDCVLPTRNARNGQQFLTSFGELNIRNAKHKHERQTY